MRAKREKIENKKRIKPLSIIICLIVVIIPISLLVLKMNKKENKHNNTNSIIDISKETQTPQIMAYITESKQNEVIKDGAKFSSSILVYSNKGNIENITHNNLEFQGTKLTEEGTYVITMKPNNGEHNMSVTITLDIVKPVIKIGDQELIGLNIIKEIDSVITLKEGKDKFTKAELITYNKKNEPDTTIAPIDITTELKSDGYKISTQGRYNIILLNENGEEVLKTDSFIIM